MKVGQIFVLGSLIRACTGSFGNVFGGVNLRNNKVGQIFSLRKEGHGPLLVPVTFFFVDHDLRHAQEALEICQKAHTSKILK